jgi:hypothetical protein
VGKGGGLALHIKIDGQIQRLFPISKISKMFLPLAPLDLRLLNWPFSCANEEPEKLIRYAALIHNSVMTLTEQWETS